ncbi:MAG: LURP-one-related family protein [Carnobacterium sp.]|uniref:LURP-one-related/scramblase family protein n=1 Tax=Carnobacterium sp. TaxID=48221 RepID=UPI002FC9122C
MMKLFIKEKRFSWRDTLIVRDEQDNVVYEVKSELLSIGNKVHIQDQEGKEVASIEEKKMGFSPKYTIYQMDKKVAVLKKDKNLIGSDYTIEKLDWKITGHVEKDDFHIKKGFGTIATFKKKFLSIGDVFVLDVDHEEDTVMALTIVIAIWCLKLDAEEAEKKE